VEIDEKTNLKKNSFLVLFASIFRQAISIISGIIVARILFPEDFGIIGMAATFSGLIDVFSRFGFEAFVISRQEIDQKEINSVYLSNIFVGLLSAAVILVGAPIVAILYKTPEVKYILFFAAFLFIVNSLMSIPRALFIREMRQDFISKVEIFHGFLNTCLVITMALMLAPNGFGYLSYVIALLIANSLVCLIYLLKRRWKFSREIDRPILKQSFRYGKSFLPKTILNYFVYNSDYIFVGALLGPALLGYYCFGFDKASIFAGLLVGLHCTVFFPLFSKFQQEPQELKKTFFSLVEKQALIVYPLIFIQIILAKEIINIIYSSKWDGSILTFQLILGYTFWRTSASIIHVLFDAVDMPQQNLKHFLVVTPICIAAFLLGTKMGGLIGVSIAACLAHTFSAFLLFGRTCRVFGWNLKELFVTLIKYLIPLIVQAPIIILFRIYLIGLGWADWAVLLAVMPASLLLYLLIVRKDAFNFYKGLRHG